MYALKRDFPHLQFSLNGGIQSVEEVCQVLAYDQQGQQVHGVMIGRAAYNMPWNVFACADSHVFGRDENPAISRQQVWPSPEFCACPMHSYLQSHCQLAQSALWYCHSVFRNDRYFALKRYMPLLSHVSIRARTRFLSQYTFCTQFKPDACIPAAHRAERMCLSWWSIHLFPLMLAPGSNLGHRHVCEYGTMAPCDVPAHR